MLVPSMNHDEICAQVKRESDKISETTMLRLMAEYNRERKKQKVKKDSAYPKEYMIRTAEKNNWIIFMHKAPAIEKYTGEHCICSLSVVYFYSDKGLKVFLHAGEKVFISFSGHFFKRYNERLNLNLSNPIDIVKQYFRTGLYSQNKIIEKDDATHIIGFAADGIQLGLVKNKRTHIEWKTFVSKDLVFRNQDEMGQEVINELMAEIEQCAKNEMIDPRDLVFRKNIYLSLTAKLRA